MTRPEAAGSVPFFDRARETAPSEILRRWQWERLAAGLGEVWRSNAFWRGRLQTAGIANPRDIGGGGGVAGGPPRPEAPGGARPGAPPPRRARPPPPPPPPPRRLPHPRAP